MNDIIETTTPVVVCDGNGDTNGHPRVYLNMGDQTQVVCPYCSRTFKLKIKGKHE
jgi:uncharacterized Zn-finger protein